MMLVPSWPKVRLGDLIDEAAYGTSVKCSEAVDGVPVLRMGNVRYDGTLDLEDLKYAPLSDQEIAKFGLKAGDILFNRTNSKELVGKTGLWDGRFPAAAASYFIRLRVNAGLVEPEWVWWFMNSVFMKRRLFETARGAIGQANINSEELKAFPVPVPPLEEQRRIVDILNHAASIRRLRDEAKAKAHEIIPALFVEMFGDPLRNPRGWTVQRLSEVALFSSGATPSKQEPRFWGSGTPWVSAKDMKPDPIVCSEDAVTAAALAETNLKLIPPNSVLLVVRGMILAHTVPIRVNVVPVTINQDLKALCPKDDLLHHQFLRWCLQCLHAHLLTKVSNAAHGTTKLDMEIITNLKIPLPPIALQQEFAERVAEVEAISALNDKAVIAAEQLAQSLMSQVFAQ